MKRLLKSAAAVALLAGVVPSASAYDDEVHYALTYCVARSVGYTAMQSERIANACVGVDYAYDTEPVQMHGARFAAEMWAHQTGLLDLLPAVGDILDSQFKPSSPLDFLEPEDTSERLESPGSFYNQGPRLKFHGFVREPGGEAGKPWYLMSNEEREAYQNSEAMNLRGQATLLWNDAIRHRNPGVFLHFFQDLVPHAGYGAKYGHYDVFVNKHRRMAADMPQGPITDWMAFRAQPASGSGRCLHSSERDRLYVNRELFEATAARLFAYMCKANERQVPLAVQVDEDLLMALVQTNCPPTGNLQTVGDLLDYKSDDTRFRPSLDRTRGALSQWMQRQGMEDRDVPEPRLPLPYEIRADRNFYFAGLRDQEGGYYEPDPDKGWQEEPGAESDAWVLWGDLTVKLRFPRQYEPADSFEVVALLPATQPREKEYELASLNEPWPKRFLKDDAPVVLRGLPVGEVLIELRRADGVACRHPQRVPITRRETNEVEVAVDWATDRVNAFLLTDHQLIDSRFSGELSNYLGGIMETGTPGIMDGPVRTIMLRVILAHSLGRMPGFEEKDELRQFNQYVTEGYFIRHAGHERRAVGPNEIVFIQRATNVEKKANIVCFSYVPNRGFYICAIWGAEDTGPDRLLAEWEQLKTSVDRLLDLRAEGIRLGQQYEEE